MNKTLKEKMVKELNKAQQKCTSYLISEEELMNICEKAEEKAIDLMKLSDKFKIIFEHHDGNRKKGFNYTTTCVYLTFNKCGTIKDFKIYRCANGYSVSRIQVINKDEFTELELKLLRIYEDMTTAGYIEV